MSKFSERIDTHAHFVPPVWRQACEDNGHSKIDGMPGIPPWSEKAHLEMMDALSIRRSILSITSPGVHLVPGNNDLAISLARACNDFAADLKRRHPTRFGFWASLPLPHVGASINEARRALDELNADGIVVLTNHHGHYLGDALFEPLWAELSGRRAIVFVHPTTPYMQASCDAHSVTPAVPLPQYPRPMFEFLFDTARTAINLFLSGTMRRHQLLRFILSHAGGVLPVLVERFALISALQGVDMGGEDEAGIKQTLRERFYFDLAGFPYPAAVRSLLMYIGTDHVLYGSDYCLTPFAVARTLVAQMEEWAPEIWAEKAERRKVLVENAEGLLGR